MRLILIVLTALSFPAFAQVYKWTDENGVTHFGSQPPPGQQDQVEARNAPPSGSDLQVQPRSEILRQSRALERRKAEEARARSQRRYNQAVAGVRNSDSDRPDYVCQGAENRLQSAKERWAAQKRQGYSISDENYYEQMIASRQRHRDNICR